MRVNAFFVVPYFCPWKSQEQINIETKGKCLRSCSATCKLLCISCLAGIRVVVFTTQKMPKVLIASVIRAARPGWSKPPTSLGVRPRLAQKEDEGAFSRSVRVRATKRRRRIFSLGRCHVSDRGERKP